MSVASKQIMPSPVEVTRVRSTESNVGMALTIQWSTGEISTIPCNALRKNCPCATCKESKGEINHSAPLAPPPSVGKSLLKVIKHTSSESLDLQEVWPVGNYALGLRWGDGHDSGIFTYSLLYELTK